MSARRSDALQALAQEVAELTAAVRVAAADEDEARQEAAAARQALDLKRAARERLEKRAAVTRDALDLVAKRDEVADDVVDALIARAAR